MTYTYCPSCGKQGTVIANNETDYQCTHCHTRFWNNPRAATSIVFLKDDEIMVAKRGVEPDKSKYELPGGFLNFGENAYDCCVREVREEMGIDIKASNLELLTVYTSTYLSDLSTADMVFVATSWKGEPVADDDVAALEWKPLSFLKSEEFFRPYHDLTAKIQAYTNK